MEISVIHPSRQRADQSFRTISNWKKLAVTKSIEYIISLDSDDPQLDLYRLYYKDTCIIIINDNKSSIEAINNGAKISIGRLIMVVSDDTVCPHGWDEKILLAIGKASDVVLKTNDGIQKTMLTMPIIERTYFNRDGYIYNPIYDHLFADKEFSDVAYARKRVIKKMGLKFPHKHYSRTGQSPDEVHLKNELTYEPGKRIYLERKKIHFGL